MSLGRPRTQKSWKDTRVVCPDGRCGKIVCSKPDPDDRVRVHWDDGSKSWRHVHQLAYDR